MFKTSLRLFAVLFLLSSVLIFSFFNVFDDVLFFHSDPSSILRFITFFSIGLSLILFLLTIPFLKHPRMLEVISLLAGSVLAGAFLFFVIDAFARQFGVLPALRKYNLEVFFVFLWPLLCLAIGFRFFRSSARAEFAARVTRVAVVLLPCLVFLSVLQTPLGANDSRPKRIVLIVLDAMPSNYLHSFNTEIPPVRLDQLFQEAIVFRNMRTRTPWTNGYFGTLYSGGPWFTFEGWAPTLNRWRRALLHPRWNLLAALQKKGVKTRWLVEHNAAIPESRQIYGYRGLRSFLLGDRFSPILDRLRIDYNLLIGLPGTRSVVTPRRKPAYQLFNKEKNPDNVLLEYLIPQIERINKQSSRTFLVFHVRWPMALGHTLTPQDYEIDQMKDPAVNKILGTGYRYTEKEQWFAEKLAANYAANMAIGQIKVSDFLQEFKKRNLMKDTLLIVTSDHGEMAARGRLWYGYHPEEEILRVPMAIFSNGRAGVDDRNLDTDNLMQTIVEFFDTQSVPASKARSLFAPVEKNFTASVTLSSDESREWFVVLYRSDLKYVFNIHQNGTGDARKFRLQPGSFNTILLAEGDEVLNEARPYLKEALVEFRISPSQLHASYRNLLNQ